ncbi:MAG: hypothetical protein JSV91_07925 [Phycisphaerales bacterium]|nr:MAG: hypothetical protein JSV91_07925 [Phycisphaerales bacterium]
MRENHLQLGAAALAAAAISAASTGQCTVIDFENYATGTTITTQYDGVTFSAEPGSCDPYWTVYPIIIQPADGTSSPYKALGIQTGCPDFSPDYLQMVFDDPQRYVTFTLGEGYISGVTLQVRAYDTSNTQIWGKTYISGAGVFMLVEVGEPDWPAQIKTIKVESPIQLYEAIDDLSFNYDDTAPDARIDSPVWADCLCEPSVTVTGIACDYNGEYDRDWLEYRSVNADPEDPWVFIGEYVGYPVCDPGTLYNWDLTDVPHGWHHLRLSVKNACGLVTTATRTVYVDQDFGALEITSPAEDEEICGTVKIVGTVNDGCGKCFDYYTVDYKYAGYYYPVDPANPTYSNIIINGNLATWDTTDVPDGTYPIRVRGFDDCDNVETKYVNVVIDNSSGCGCSADANDDGQVNIDDIFEVLAQWGPCK